MLYLLLAALGLFAIGGKSVSQSKPLSKHWSKTWLVPSSQEHVFDTSPTEPFPGAKKAMTMITEALYLHGAPVWTTPDGKLVAFRPLSEAKVMQSAGFVLYADPKNIHLAPRA